MDIIDNYFNFEWNWCSVSMNPNITLEFLIKHQTSTRLWCCIGRNPNLTLEMIQMFYSKIEWGYISMNEFHTQEQISEYNILTRSSTQIQLKCNSWIDKPICCDGKYGLSAVQAAPLIQVASATIFV